MISLLSHSTHTYLSSAPSYHTTANTLHSLTIPIMPVSSHPIQVLPSSPPPLTEQGARHGTEAQGVHGQFGHCCEEGLGPPQLPRCAVDGALVVSHSLHEQF